MMKRRGEKEKFGLYIASFEDDGGATTQEMQEASRNLKRQGDFFSPRASRSRLALILKLLILR